MFQFLKRKENLLAISSLPIITDIHSHILPGIDDGSPDMETSLQLIKGIAALGITKTIATPHIIGDMYRNTPLIINQVLEEVKEACLMEGIDISISAAAEYMLDDYFLHLLKQPAPLLTLHKNIILTELSFAAPTENLHEIAFEIISAGYRPIMAHPERYHFYHNDFTAYNWLKDMGFLLQVNLLSITGYYGKNVAKAAKYILTNNLADLAGTDMHHARHLEMLQAPKNLQLFKEYLGHKCLNNFDSLL